MASSGDGAVLSSPNNTIVDAASDGSPERGRGSLGDRDEQLHEIRIYYDGSDRSAPGSAARSVASQAAIWPHSGSNSDGRGRHSGSLVVPWAGSPSGATGAWNAADKLEAAIPTTEEIRLATRPRRILVGISCALYLVAVIFLIVAQTGSTSTRRASTGIYFFRLDLSDVFANATANSTDTALVRAVAQSIGLHDYYQAGLWGFCAGDRATGFTECSRPRAFYWFDPVAILLDELLLHSTVALPARVAAVLTVVRVLSQVMFGVVFAGMLLASVLMLASPLVLLSRWWSLPAAALAAAAGLALIVGAAIATALALAYRFAASAISQLNIGVTVGAAMLVLLWGATVLSLAAVVLHTVLGCSSAPSVRDVRTGRRPFVRMPPETLLEKTPATSAAALRKRPPFLSPLTMHPVADGVPAAPVPGPALVLPSTDANER